MKQDYEPGEERKLIDRLPSKLPSPSESVEKINAYESLSDEAKWLIGIVLDTPSEFIDLITDGRKRMTSKSVKKFVESIWPSFSVQYVLSELRKWTNNL